MAHHNKTAIVWLRNDLRLQDNPALSYASQHYQHVIPLYILEDNKEILPLGGASRWWLHYSLQSLERRIHALGGTLILRQGHSTKILLALAKEVKADAVFWNRCYEPLAIKRDSVIKEKLRQAQVLCKSFNASLLFEPWEIKTLQGTPYSIFTPFWKSCLKQGVSRAPAPNIIQLSAPPVDSDFLKDWSLLPTKPDWAQGLRDTWQPGEEGAHIRFDHFLKEGLNHYVEGRNYPAQPYTSMISPHLHFGEISPLYLYRRVESATYTLDVRAENVERYLAELGWREFSYYLLYHFPALSEISFRPAFESFPWQNNEELLKAWQKGQTGYPIIDAGMRQLYATGWMHNRVRMLVASFLTKDLHIHWKHGAAWFWDTLVDADLANNSAGWQWVAGSGADAAPYFRIFNPVLQGIKFDPTGAYVKHWIPELSKLPLQYTHEPYMAPEHVLQEASIELGKNYPLPIVDHNKQKRLALEAYKKCLGKSS
jgi:deoxyribodipyrimidine photo-lyase